MFDRRSTVDIDLQEVKKDFERLNDQIQRILYKTGYDFDNVLYNRNNPDEAFMRSQYYDIADKLNDIEQQLSYLNKPVSEEGVLRHNNAGRYELPSGEYFTSGSGCEILVEEDEESYWVYTSIEHNGEDYYATALGRDVSISGMVARIRR